MTGGRENFKSDLESQRICNRTQQRDKGDSILMKTNPSKPSSQVQDSSRVYYHQGKCLYKLPNHLHRGSSSNRTYNITDLHNNQVSGSLINTLKSWLTKWFLIISNPLIVLFILRFKLLTEFFQISIQKMYVEKHKFYFLAKNFETFFFY